MKNRRNPQRRRTVVGASAVAASLLVALALASPASAATRAHFTKGPRVLTVVGDSRGDNIIVGRDPNGVIEVNGGAVAIRGARATVSNVDLIVVLGGSGNDHLAIDEANGPLPRALLFGGAGDDELSGGASNDRLF